MAFDAQHRRKSFSYRRQLDFIRRQYAVDSIHRVEGLLKIMSNGVETWEVDYIRAARHTVDGKWTFRVKWVGYSCRHNSFVKIDTAMWEPEECLIDCAVAVHDFSENSALKEVEDDGREVYEGNPAWLREKAKAAKTRDAQQPANPKPTIYSNEEEPDPSTLWKPPSHFGVDENDRTLTYETVVDCLDLVGIDGRELYRRVKRDNKDGDEKVSQMNHLYGQCLTIKHPRTGLKKIIALLVTSYLVNLILTIQFLGPYCRKETYFVSSKWIFGDENKRQAAITKAKEKHQKQKTSRKRKRKAEEKKLQKELEEREATENHSKIPL
ncbi:hypothetical protein V5O48_017883 [Marasmius crinis-equi]|uniref:Chromo domain-containing protein n=1 Tax=Marasmius crinis-equi TaxID=585013 RepID=A0ABR3EMV5_9AGAR